MTTAGPDLQARPAVTCRWPAIVYWCRGADSATMVSDVVGALRADRAEHVAMPCDEHTIALFLARDDRGPRSGLGVPLLVERVVELVGARNGGRRPQAIIAEAAVPAAEVATQTRRLLRLRRYVEARPAGPQGAVVSDRSLMLARLLEGVDGRRVADFVHGQIGALLAYDRIHGTDLARVLEIGLDAPNRDEAARAAHMHRNTFRRHLNHALQLVELDPEDGDQGLAVHLALRLAHVTAVADVSRSE